MIKAIILDNGYSPKDVVVKFGKNYMSVSLSYFLNSLCKRHDSDYNEKNGWITIPDYYNNVYVKEVA